MKYGDRIEAMIEDGGCRLIVSMNDLLSYDDADRGRFHRYVESLSLCFGV